MRRVWLFVVFVAVFQGWMSFSGIASSAHDPSRWEAQASATLLEGAHDADHSHDDPIEDDRGDVHQHGHNAADHSHDKPSLTSSAGARMLSPARNWRAAQDSRAYPSPYFVFERPPKSSPMY
jgi:hypothetical protein